MPAKNPDVPTPTPRMPDPRLLRTACRFFLQDVIELLHPEMAAAIDFQRIEFLGEETFAELSPDRRFDADLVARLEMTDEALRQEEERAQARREQARMEERSWQELDDEDHEGYDDEDYEDEDDEEPEVSRYVLVHLVVVGEDGEDLGQRLYHHSGYLHIENHRFPITIAIVLSGGPAGIEFCEYVQGLGELVFMRFRYLACGLSESRAEAWLERRDRAGGSPALGAALAAWMPWEDADAAERKHRLRERIRGARINDGRRRFLECLVERGMASHVGPEDSEAEGAAAVEKALTRILSEEPMVESIDVSLFDKLLHAFFADAVGLIGGFGVDGVDFSHLRLLDPADAGTEPEAAPEPALCEWLAEVSRRGDADERVLLHLQLARERAGMDEWTLRRYMQLRLRFPSATVVPIVLFVARATPSDPCVCEVKERNREEITVRFRYHGFTLAANSAEDYVEDPRPVAWALAALMRPWRWKPERLKLECLLRIERGDLEIGQRALLWDFVEAQLPLEDEGETRLREALREQAEVMRETVIPYLDQRLGPLFPSNCRQRLSEAEDPMEVHHLIEEVYRYCVHEGLLPEEEEPSKWSVH